MAMDDSYNRLLAIEVLEKLEQRNIGGTYVESKEAALAVVLDMVPRESFSSCGGSETLREIGLRQAMKARGYNFLDPDDGETGAGQRRDCPPSPGRGLLPDQRERDRPHRRAGQR